MLETWEVLVILDSTLGGIILFGAAACLGIWLFDRSLRSFFWLGLLGLTMTATLVSGAIVLGQPSPAATVVAAWARNVAYGLAALTATEAAARIRPELRVGALRWSLVAFLLLHTVLSATTGLVMDGVDGSGFPRYGPLAFITASYSLGVVALGVIVVRQARNRPRLRWFVAATGVVLVGLELYTLVNDDPLLDQQLFTVSVLPGGSATLVLAARALLRTGRSRDEFARRQEIILRISQAAVSDSVDALRQRVQRTLRTEFGDGVVVAVGEPDRMPPQPTRSAPTVRVTGRKVRATARGVPEARAPQQFVESLLRLLVASADRAISETDAARGARYDEATGLLGAAGLRDRLDDDLATASRPVLVLALCRLDGLGALIAVDGPDGLRCVLGAAATALDRLRRPRTILARSSDDTLAVADHVPVGIEADAFLRSRMAEVLRTLREAIDDDSIRLRLGGVVARADASAGSLLRDATAALQRAPRDGSLVYAHDEAEEVRSLVALSRELAHAVERDEIELRYQPVVSPGTRRVISVEALARWRRGGVVVAPSAWIPAAEQYGHIIDVGRRVLQLAAADQMRLGVPVAVNVSPLQLVDEHVVSDILAAVAARPPGSITLEITETAVMADLDRAIAVLQELRDHGLRIALDDFGSSYSSLGALADLPVDVLKLDSSFVRRIETPNGLTVVRSIVSLARSLGKPLIAEGVETEEQLALLTALGVERVQGYLVGRPATVDVVAERLLVVGAVAEVR